MALGWRSQYSRYKGFFLNILSLYKQRADLRAFTEVALSISSIAIFLVFALKPTALTIISLTQEINEKRETLENLNQKIDNLRKAQAVYSQNQGLVLNVDTAIATIPQPEIITKQVVGLAAKNSLSVLGLSVGQVTLLGKNVATKKTAEFKPLPGNAQEMPVSISVQGDYPNILLFIKDLESLRISSKIDSIGIGASVTNEEKVIVALITARIPFLGE
jgi:Tfp pilus assembly protein PilO